MSTSCSLEFKGSTHPAYMAWSSYLELKTPPTTKANDTLSHSPESVPPHTWIPFSVLVPPTDVSGSLQCSVDHPPIMTMAHCLLTVHVTIGFPSQMLHNFRRNQGSVWTDL